MTIDRNDPYAVLGLTAAATQREVRHAYRALVRQYHPDTRPAGGPGHGDASDVALQRVIAAYATLRDPVRQGVSEPPATSRPTARPARTRPGPAPFARTAADQPPIRVGPVRWHQSSLPREAR